MFHNGGVLFVLACFFKVFPIHPVEVEVPGKDNVFFIGRNVGPAGDGIFFFLVLQPGEVAGFPGVLEKEQAGFLAVLCTRFVVFILFVVFLLFFHHLCALDVEGEGVVILEPKLFQGQVLGIEGIFCDLREFRGQLHFVEKFLLGGFGRVGHVPVGAFRSLVFVPEQVRCLEPNGPDTGGKDHFVCFFAGKTGSQLVIGFFTRCAPLRLCL